MRATLAQAGLELRLTLRRGENVLVSLIMPIALLLFLSSTNVFALSGDQPVDYLVPGILALAVMSTSLVSLGIATAYERHYGVLKRLGGTPFTRPQLIAAKLLTVLAIEVIQTLLIAGIAVLFLGWRPAGSLPLALIVALIGTAAFAGLGLLMAGTLRAEATLGLANGAYLILLLTGGIFLPLSHLPAPIAAVSPLLPAAPLADLLRSGLGGTEMSVFSAIILILWAVASNGLAALTFRWE
jgi:ABC-2 type transport system permease protein